MKRAGSRAACEVPPSFPLPPSPLGPICCSVGPRQHPWQALGTRRTPGRQSLCSLGADDR